MPTFVQEINVTGAPAVTNITSGSVTFTAGNNLLFIFYNFNNNVDIVTSIVDTFSVHNTYVRLPSSSVFDAQVFGGATAEIWYAENISGGTGTITATHSGGGGGASMLIGEVSGLFPSGSFDVASFQTGNSTNPSVNVTLLNAVDFVIAGLLTTAGGNNTASFVNMTPRDGNAIYGTASTTSPGVFTASTIATTGNWLFTIAGFKAIVVSSMAQSTVCIME